MIVLVGASASGKTELSKILFNKYGYTKCITTTTRDPRIGEINDVDYHFLNKDEFLNLESKNAFFEVSTYQNNYYGIQKNDVNYQGLVIVDPSGANALIKELKNDVFIVYVEANKSLRMDRMYQRSDEALLIKNRIINDDKVFDKANLLRIDLNIVNENHQLDTLALEIHEKYLIHMHNNK